MVCVCAFVLPDALRAVVVIFALDAGLAASLDAAVFLSMKSVIVSWAVGFVFLAGLIFASLSTLLPQKGVKSANKYTIDKGK